MNEPLLPAVRPDWQVVPTSEGDGAPASPLPVKRVLACLLKYWWLPVLTLVLALGSAALYVRQVPATFVSRGRMWETVKLRIPESSLFQEDVQTAVGTQTELLQSGTLREMALARLRAATNGVAIPLGKDGEPLLVQIRAMMAPKSSVFTLEASAADGAYAQAYLAALMTEYLEYKRNVRKVVSGDTLASVSEQLQRQERDMQIEQDALIAYQRTNNLALMREESAVAGGYLTRLKTQLSDLQLENRLMEATPLDEPASTNDTANAPADWLERVLRATASSPTGGGGDRQAAVNAHSELEQLKAQREKLSQNLRPKHPKIVRIDNEIQQREQVIELFRRQLEVTQRLSREQRAEQRVAARQANQLKMQNLMTSIKEWETKVIEANAKIAEADRLRLNVQRLQGVYDRLSSLVQNIGISRNIDQETLSILEPARPAVRTYASEIRTLVAAGVGGLGLGLGIILLLGVRDDRLTSETDVNERLGQNLVGHVPVVRTLKGVSTLPLLQADDARYEYAEAFRSLRSALLFMAAEAERPRLVLITSALPHEGKSTVAANLARTLALGGSRVVLVDADLRRGRLHELLGLSRGPGLAEVLRDPGQLPQVLRTNCLPNLTFISAGKAEGHCGDLFLGSTFEAVLSRLREQFDYVIIDSSPVFAADDAATLAPKMDGTLFVVRNQFSRAIQVRIALNQLYQRNARVLGVILNQVDTSSRSYYYYKHAGYSPTA